MASEVEIYAPRYGLTQCRSLPAARRAQGAWVGVLACIALLLPSSVALPAPDVLAATMGGNGNSSTEMTLTAKAAGFLSMLGVHAQLRPYGADSEKLPKKGAKEFFQEFLDLALKLLVSINFVVTIFAAVRLWLDQQAAKRPRKDLRICPHCYELIRQKNATRCPYCRVALPPESRIVTLSPRAGADRCEPARVDAVHKTQPLQPVRKEPVRAELLREEPQVQESEHWEEEEDAYDDWEDEEQARYRKQRIYAVSVAILIGWITAALIFLLRLI